MVLRYVGFCVLFLCAIFCSFWIFVWNSRTDIAASLLERSCPPYKVHIGHIEWVNWKSLALRDIQIRDQNDHEVAHIINAELTTSPLSWAHWFFIPSKKPLLLSQVRLHIEKAHPFNCEEPKTPLFVIIEKVILINGDGEEKVITNQSGLLSEILLDLFGSL